MCYNFVVSCKYVTENELLEAQNCSDIFDIWPLYFLFKMDLLDTLAGYCFA